jgi:hypothetical protein
MDDKSLTKNNFNMKKGNRKVCPFSFEKSDKKPFPIKMEKSIFAA